MGRPAWRIILIVIAATALAAGPALGHPTYFTSNCSGCHSNDSATCIGCHHHGGSPSNPTTNKTQYAPGELVTVTFTGSSRGGWARAILYDQNGQELTRVTGPTNMGDDGTGNPALKFPFHFTVPAPLQAGTYTWRAAWWGNNDGAGHLEGTRLPTNSFQVISITGSVTINGGAFYSNSAAVTLGLSISGGTAAQMRFSNDNVGWSAWEPYAAGKAWALAPGDGVKTVYVQFGDSGGGVLAGAGDAITLDGTAPVGGISLNAGAAYTSAPLASIALWSTDALSGVSQMRFSTDNLAWNPWEAYAPGKSLALPAGDGTKTVYVQFRDAAGNVSPSFSDSIVLDTAPPTGSVIINEGLTVTKTPNVILTFTAKDTRSGVGAMRVSNNGTVWSAWQPYNSRILWTLLTGDGRKIVYVQFRDGAGNASALYSDTIILNSRLTAAKHWGLYR